MAYEANSSQNHGPQLSPDEMNILIGIKINQIYCHMSTTLQKVVMKNMAKAASFILASNCKTRPRINRIYTISNALTDIGMHERYRNSVLSQFVC